MRWLLAFCVLISAVAMGQQPERASLFDTIRPDMSIVVKKHPVGADMVEITMLQSNFPEALLQDRANALGAALGSAPRGLTVVKQQLDPNNPKLAFIKATFAVDGLTIPDQGRIRLQPLVQAFTGLPEDASVKGISIIFDGVSPSKNTVQTLATKAVDVEGRINAEPKGLEYRIHIKTSNPAEVEIPDRVEEPKPAPTPSASRGGIPIAFWIALAVAGIAAGILVYSALLRGGRSGPVGK